MANIGFCTSVAPPFILVLHEGGPLQQMAGALDQRVGLRSVSWYWGTEV
jgi:hypothetical protein